MLWASIMKRRMSNVPLATRPWRPIDGSSTSTFGKTYFQDATPSRKTLIGLRALSKCATLIDLEMSVCSSAPPTSRSQPASTTARRRSDIWP
jgi:hypothetical protein